MEKLFTAIIYTKDNTFLKYRNIRNYAHNENNFYNPKFEAFLATKAALTVNLYYKESKQFFKQLKLN